MFDVQRRREAIESGGGRGALDRELTGDWERVHRGIYIRCHDDADDGERWIAKLSAHLLRGGKGAAISHRAAAQLHGLDGNWGRAEDVIVPLNSPFRAAPAIRSRTLVEPDTQCHWAGGRALSITTIARTLMDLGVFLGFDDLEVALESAFRGDDPRRPRDWREDRLVQLQNRLATAPSRQPGVAVVRAVLAGRPFGTVPTGSYAETRMVQALRRAGLTDVERQVRVRLLGRRGELIRTAYLDLLVPSGGLAIEVDGFEAHGTPAALSRDLARQNDVGDVFPLRRFAATQVSADPSGVARNVVDKVRDGIKAGTGVPMSPGETKRLGRYLVTRTASGFDARGC